MGLQDKHRIRMNRKFHKGFIDYSCVEQQHRIGINKLLMITFAHRFGTGFWSRSSMDRIEVS